MSASLRISLPDFEVDSIEQTIEAVTITAHAIQVGGCCPECGQVAQRVHSWYTRQPRDLPCLGQVVQLVLQARRFFCDNPVCGRRTFVEGFAPFLERYARRTRRVLGQVERLSLATSGEQSEVLTQGVGIPTSATTVIRHLRKRSLEPMATPRVLGVDDWAMKKGQRYGTIRVDLEAHRAIDLLADREADTFAAWLKAHPGVEIISRDRGSTYIDGANQGAPKAVQVADRWHLLHNMRETVQELLETQRGHLAILGQTPHKSQTSSAASSTLKKRAWAYNRQERYQRYERMVELAGQGLDNQAIARAVGVSVTTVRKYLAAGEFPEWQPRPIISKWLLPYVDYLQQRWNEGCHNAAQLWRELCHQGYTRSRTLVYDYVARLRSGLPTHPETVSTPQFSVIRRYSPRQASWLLVSQAHTLDEEQKQDLATR